MAWDFETNTEYRKLLDWADEFVRDEVEPLDLAWPGQEFVPLNEARRKAIHPLKDQVRSKGLRARAKFAEYLQLEVGNL